MEGGLYFIALLIVAIAVYRQVARRLSTPQIVVRLLLRRYHAFQRMGLSEQESLFRLLRSRRGWRNLPERFLAEIVGRLKSKEDVMRFISLAEGYRFHRERLPAIASNRSLDSAMRQVALWLIKFGQELQNENLLKQAEFVQKLALGLEPERHFTHLALATTYYKMARHADATPLFEQAFVLLEKHGDNAVPEDERNPSAADNPAPTATELRTLHQPRYEACLSAIRATHEKSPESSSRG